MFLNFKIDYIKIDHNISDIKNNAILSNNLNGLTNLDEKEMQKVLQKTSDIAAKEGGFKGTLSIYNDDSSTKGYDYTQDKIPTVVTIATPNRKDYTMDPHIKEYYNVYNTYDKFVQGWAGGSDMPNFKESVKVFGFLTCSYCYISTMIATKIVTNKKYTYKDITPIEELQKFDYTTPSQIAKEPNAVNVKIEQDYGRIHFMDNHSKFKNPETMQILQKEMGKRRNHD